MIHKKLLTCLSLLLITGCVNYDVEPYEDIEPYIAEVDLSQLEYAYSLEKVEVNKVYRDSEGKTIQDFLNDKSYLVFTYGEVLVAEDLEEFYDIVEQQLMKLDKFVGIHLKSPEMPVIELELLYKELINTNDKISATLLWYTYEVERVNDGIFISLYNDFTASESEYTQVLAKMDTLIEELHIDDLSPYEKVETLYKYVMERMTYKDLGTNLAHSPMGFLLHGEGVCQAYAVSLHMLLERAGIDSRYIVGEIHEDYLDNPENPGHAWNMVKLNGKWYHLDATWDDEYEEWEFFLVSDTKMSFTRSWETQYYDVAEEPYSM